MKTWWKVFYRYPKSYQLKSIAVFGKATIYYKRKKVNTTKSYLERKGYFPVVFDSRESAEFFANGYGNSVILPVAGEKVEVKPICSIAKLTRLLLFKRSKSSDWPIGTIAVRNIRILPWHETDLKEKE